MNIHLRNFSFLIFFGGFRKTLYLCNQLIDKSNTRESDTPYQVHFKIFDNVTPPGSRILAFKVVFDSIGEHFSLTLPVLLSVLL